MHEANKLSFVEYLLAPGAVLSLITGEQDESKPQDQTMLERLKEKIVFARAQSLDIYLGTRHIQ